MTTIDIDASKITDFDTFHEVFRNTLGFTDGYGNNMNAWIDCMRDIHEDTGMSNVLLPKNEPLVLKINSSSTIKEACPEVLEALASCTGHVNVHLYVHNLAPIYLLFV